MMQHPPTVAFIVPIRSGELNDPFEITERVAAFYRYFTDSKEPLQRGRVRACFICEEEVDTQGIQEQLRSAGIEFWRWRIKGLPTFEEYDRQMDSRAIVVGPAEWQDYLQCRPPHGSQLHVPIMEMLIIGKIIASGEIRVIGKASAIASLQRYDRLAKAVRDVMESPRRRKVIICRSHTRGSLPNGMVFSSSNEHALSGGEWYSRGTRISFERRFWGGLKYRDELKEMVEPDLNWLLSTIAMRIQNEHRVVEHCEWL